MLGTKGHLCVQCGRHWASTECYTKGTCSEIDFLCPECMPSHTPEVAWRYFDEFWDYCREVLSAKV